MLMNGWQSRGILVLASRREIDPLVVAPMEVVGNWAGLVWKNGRAPPGSEAAFDVYPAKWRRGLPRLGLSIVKGPMGGPFARPWDG